MSEYMKSPFEYHDLIEAIVPALGNRDIHTLHHSRRVSNMTEYIAINTAAELIGKQVLYICPLIGIPVGILP